MIIDAQQFVSDRQTVSGTTNSIDVIDLGQNLPPSMATMCMNLTVHSLTGTLSVIVQQSSNNSTFETLTAGSAAELGGYTIKIKPTKRYVRVQYSATAASVSAWLSPTPAADWRALPDAL